MTEELALLCRNLAVRDADADTPATAGVAYEAFEYLVAALETGSMLPTSAMAATQAVRGRDMLARRHRCCRSVMRCRVSSRLPIWGLAPPANWRP
jgi:hypothetical protein